MSDTPAHTSRPRLHGADTAPVVEFDGAPIWGISQGAGRILLEMLINDEDEAGKPIFTRRAVLHLRGNSQALESLRKALDGVILMLAKPAGGEN